MPPTPRPPRLSRRHFLAAAPTAMALEAGAAPAGSLPERARAWNDTRELVRGLLLRWQDLEKEVAALSAAGKYAEAIKKQEQAGQDLISNL